LVTEPPPKPRWGFSPTGYVAPELSLTTGDFKTLTDILELSDGYDEYIRLTLTKLSHEILMFEYTLEAKSGKYSPGQALATPEILAMIISLKEAATRLRRELIVIDQFSRSLIYAQDPHRRRGDIITICRLCDDILLAEKAVKDRNTRKKGTFATRTGRFVALKLIDLYEHFPNEPPLSLLVPGGTASTPLRKFINSKKRGPDAGPRFVIAALKLLLPGISDTQARTALRYASGDHRESRRHIET
jgi:hypothetical protein